MLHHRQVERMTDRPVLRPYQVEDLDRIEAAFAAGTGRVLHQSCRAVSRPVFEDIDRWRKPAARTDRSAAMTGLVRMKEPHPERDHGVGVNLARLSQSHHHDNHTPAHDADKALGARSLFRQGPILGTNTSERRDARRAAKRMRSWRAICRKSTGKVRRTVSSTAGIKTAKSDDDGVDSPT